MRRLLLAALALLCVIALWTGSAPVTAQEFPLATNTPRVPSATPRLPDGALDFYALRLWDEAGLIDVLRAQVLALREGDTDGALAVRLLQHELRVRFPAAPRDPRQRDALLMAMLAAPLGSVDMRALAWAHLVDALNLLQPSFAQPDELQAGNWRYSITPANVDNRPPADALIVSEYRANGETRYIGAAFASGAPGQGYRLFAADYPAAPQPGIRALPLIALVDANGDRLDDLAIGIQDDDPLNDELRLYGLRGDAVASLIAPGESVRYRMLRSEGGSWARDGRFTVEVARVDSARWGCIAQQPVTWAWVFNYLRQENAGSFTAQQSLGCAVFALEPLFSLPPSEAIASVEAAFARADRADPTSGRVQLGLAVLLAMGGDTQRALALAEDYGDPDLAAQAAALRGSIAQIATPAQHCAAVIAAAQTPESALCVMDEVLERLFTAAPLRRDEDIESQLTRFGISVRERTTIRQVGRLDRQAFRFDLAGSGWWAFAPLQADTYTAERIPTPAGLATATPPPAIPPVTEAAVEALLRGDYAGALIALDNAQQARPNAPASPAVEFMRVLARDLTGDRSAARAGYYALWMRTPESLWGQLAAAHLERR